MYNSQATDSGLKKKLFYHNSTYFLFPTLFSHRRKSQPTPFYLHSVFFRWSESLGLQRSSRCLQRARCQSWGENLTSDCRAFRRAPAEPSRHWRAASLTLQLTAAFSLHWPNRFLCLSAPLSATLALHLRPHPPPRGSVFLRVSPAILPTAAAFASHFPPASWARRRVPHGLAQQLENGGVVLEMSQHILKGQERHFWHMTWFEKVLRLTWDKPIKGILNKERS